MEGEGEEPIGKDVTAERKTWICLEKSIHVGISDTDKDFLCRARSERIKMETKGRIRHIFRYLWQNADENHPAYNVGWSDGMTQMLQMEE